MRLHLNLQLCQGHGRCFMVAPELFDTDGDGYAILLGNGDVSPDLEEKAMSAVANCPEHAIEALDR